MEKKLYFIKYYTKSVQSFNKTYYTKIGEFTNAELIEFCEASSGRYIEKIKVLK